MCETPPEILLKDIRVPRSGVWPVMPCFWLEDLMLGVLAGLERPQRAPSLNFTEPSGWLSGRVAVRCQGCLPEFLHLLSVSLICMAWDNSFPQWEQVQRCAEDTPLFFKGRTSCQCLNHATSHESELEHTNLEAVTCTLYLECHDLICSVSILWLVEKRKLVINKQNQQYLLQEVTG